MTPDMALSIEQVLPMSSNSKPSPQEEKGIGVAITDSTSTKDSKAFIFDTVSISSQSRQAISEVRKEKETSKDAKKVETNLLNDSDKSDKATAKVEFFYDQNGDLVTKYLDSAKRLVYQTPSELMLRMKAADIKSDSSVNTKA